MNEYRLYDLNNVGKRIRNLRELNGLSQDRLAALLGFSKVHLSKVENGKQGFSPENMMRIAEYFGVTLDYLYFGRPRDHMFSSQITNVITLLQNIIGEDDYEREKQND